MTDCVLNTRYGRRIDFLNLDRKHIHIEDIAHALSHICRFNGHCRVFYSVAEHCVHVSHLTPPEHALWGLLHDAAEAYVGDLTRPVRRYPGMAAFQELEEAVLEVAASHFHLPLPIPEAVVRADREMLEAEMGRLVTGRPLSGGAADRIRCWPPDFARRMFLGRFDELVFGGSRG